MAILPILAFVLPAILASVSAGPPSSIAPDAPKSRTQIASEAYALQASIIAGAGRKTTQSECAGSATDKTAQTFTADTTWTGVHYRLTGIQRIELSVANPQIAFTVTGSCIDIGGFDGGFLVNDTTTDDVLLWDGTTAARLTFKNSTLTNGSAIVHIESNLGHYRVGAAVIRLDNATVSDFGTFLSRTGPVGRGFFEKIESSDVSYYNRAGASQCAFSQFPQAAPPNETFSIYRSHFVNNPAIELSGCVGANQVTQAKGNYFQGGFLQLVFGSNFENGVTNNYGTPTEYLNWSNNYANGSMHTVFGFYGTSVGTFGNHMGTNAYATIYRNYVNNSRYIPIQSSGNQTGLRIIGNYLRGPSPWPGGSPTFEFVIGIHDQAHGYLISRNYFFDMDAINIVGIDFGFAVYDMTVSNNVMFDVGGNFIRIEGAILKYRLDSNNTESSDYSWKENGLVFSGNYLSGGSTGAAAISSDSAYTHFYSNTATSLSGSLFLMRAGFECDPSCSFAWVDWIDGYPDTPTISWSGTIPATDESRFWIRSMRTGILEILIPLSVTVNSTSSTWGVLSTRCVQNGAAPYGHTTTDSEVLKWTGHGCGQVADKTAHPASEAFTAPTTFYNKTLVIPMNPIGRVSPIQDVSVFDLTDGHAAFSASVGNWNILPGHSYQIGSPLFSEALFFNSFIIFAFMAVLVLVVIGAVWLRRRFA